MVQTLDQDTIEQRLAALRPREPAAPTYHYVRPLGAQADDLIDALGAETGITLGLGGIDLYTRGFRPRDFVLITGFSHSGKTQVVNTMIRNNPDKRILFFSLDDPAAMILAKLAAMETGVGAEVLERQVREGDADVRMAIRRVAKETFTNLFIVDDALAIEQMKSAILEAEDAWGAPCDAVIIDYLESIPGAKAGDDGGEAVKKMAQIIKGWANECETHPIIVVHQNTRSNGKPGKKVTMLSGAYGGEQQATIGLGVWRKLQDDDLDEVTRLRHANTVTLNVFKNKRPGGRCSYDGTDFYMDPETGMIRPLRDGEIPMKGGSAAAAAQIQSRRQVVTGAFDGFDDE